MDRLFSTTYKRLDADHARLNDEHHDVGEDGQELLQLESSPQEAEAAAVDTKNDGDSPLFTPSPAEGDTVLYDRAGFPIGQSQGQQHQADSSGPVQEGSGGSRARSRSNSAAAGDPTLHSNSSRTAATTTAAGGTFGAAGATAISPESMHSHHHDQSNQNVNSSTAVNLHAINLQPDVIPPPAEEIDDPEDNSRAPSLNEDVVYQSSRWGGRNYFRSFISLPKSPASIANMIALTFLLGGFILGSTILTAQSYPRSNKVCSFFRTIGLFSLTLGLMNALAVSLLFDKNRFILQSGTFRRNYKGIRTALRTHVLNDIIEPSSLSDFAKENCQSLFIEKMRLDQKLRKFMSSQRFKDQLQQQTAAHCLDDSAAIPRYSNGVLKILKYSCDSLICMLLRSLDADGLFPPHALWEVVAGMVAGRTENLTPGKVKEIIEDLIRRYLGWVILWGNVFGAIVGFLVELFTI